MVVAFAVLALASAASADGIRLDVELEAQVERNVGIATGWFCDDSSLVAASLVTRGDHNVWIVRGAKLGTTQCRVGTDPTRPFTVFEVHVVPRTTGSQRHAHLRPAT